MITIPAIDLKNGCCVRLKQGRMEDSTSFSDDPVAMAGQWYTQGARRLHVVDLDGAFAGQPRHAGVVHAIARQFPELQLQVGGGIRTLGSIDAYLNAGVHWVIIGTQALKDPAFVIQACQTFPGRIIVGIDAQQGMVATEGWASVSQTPALDLALRFRDAGISALIYTDISRDGMMQGLNVEATAQLAQDSNLPVIASGGIKNLQDIEALIAVKSSGIIGAIAGRALYEGSLDLATALRRAECA